jgi:Ca2+:H+ antiporter
MSRVSTLAVRGSLVPLFALGPAAVVLDWLDPADSLIVFVLAGAALVPLAWLIGEATDNAAVYTGPGVGGFLNATFGNAPELIIAIVAVSDGLTEVVRASLVGSVAGNLLLVLGFTLFFGQHGVIDRRSAAISLGVVALATLMVAVPSVASWHGNPDRRGLAELSLPFAVVLLGVRLVVNHYALRRQRSLQREAETAQETGWPLRRALAVLGLATLVTAFVTNALVGSLEAFAVRADLSEFFVAIVIVAIVGNATEHGSAILLARRGRVLLATEISLASSAQVAGLLIPLVALASWAIDPLALAFRPIELAALVVGTVLPALVLARGRTTRAGGALLILAYAGLVAAFWLSGNR